VKFKDRDIMRKSAFTKLNGDETKQYGINEQYPGEINEIRKQRYPYYKSAKRPNKYAQLVYNKMYINGELFMLPNGEDTRSTASSSSLSERFLNPSGQSAKAPVFTPKTRGAGPGKTWV
jgi:hypothetical protein